MNAMTKLRQYTDVGAETSVFAADPHRLILLLYQGALLAIASAKNQIMRGEIEAKGRSISQAISIIEEGLKASLNLETGGEVAQNLASLYSYMSQQLLNANLHNDTAILDEVSRLLIDLRGAWENISPNPSQTAAAPSAQSQATSPRTQTPLVYGRM